MYAESILKRIFFWNTLINCKLASATNGGGQWGWWGWQGWQGGGGWGGWQGQRGIQGC